MTLQDIQRALGVDAATALRVQAALDAATPREQETCGAKRRGGFVCPLPKGHAGIHEASPPREGEEKLVKALQFAKEHAGVSFGAHTFQKPMTLVPSWVVDGALLALTAPSSSREGREALLDTPLAHIDMLMADRLRNWAHCIDEFGALITNWGDPSWVSGQMREIAQGIEDAIKASPASAPAVQTEPKP